MRVASLLGCLRTGPDVALNSKEQQVQRAHKYIVNGNSKGDDIFAMKLALHQAQQQQELQPEKRRLWLQIAAAISASLAIMGCGGYLGWTSPALPYLKSKSSPYPVTDEQGSWIVSLYILGGILGSLLSPVIVDRLGRKPSLLLFAIPQLAGWCLIIPAKSYWTLYVARLIAGIAHGGIYNVAVIYFAEIADKDIRGAFGTLLKMCTNLGSLYASIAGALLSYNNLNFVELVLPVLFVGSFWFMPETPYYHLVKGREDRATKSLMQLRRLKKPESVSADISSMRTAVEECRVNSSTNAIHELLFNKANRRGLWILLSLKATQQFSGHMAIVAYTQEIFDASGTSIEPSYAVVLLGLAQLGAGILAAALVDRLGRRPLILLSGASASVALGLFGHFFYLKDSLNRDVSSITWLPVVALVGYEIMVALGIGTIVGIHGSFWAFGACCALGTAWVVAITPETKGKSLEEIQEILMNGGSGKCDRGKEQKRVDLAVIDVPEIVKEKTGV
ncbi:hypothetical protein QAD02_009792 [Eretmocerus hayati]|uniref:Uncharacterized protein n=1 Tax=Eretmocerus hayati TaxID=131215 RepID=A0ACC2NAP7_9HYME|nr:hypothetical protein QAD02_009792 [Eretmocerus hayati]